MFWRFASRPVPFSSACVAHAVGWRSLARVSVRFCTTTTLMNAHLDLWGRRNIAASGKGVTDACPCGFCGHADSRREAHMVKPSPRRPQLRATRATAATRESLTWSESGCSDYFMRRTRRAPDSNTHSSRRSSSASKMNTNSARSVPSSAHARALRAAMRPCVMRPSALETPSRQ